MTQPFFFWEDGGAVFLDSVSRTVLLERPAALALQLLLLAPQAPDSEGLRDWLIRQGCEYVIESDFEASYADVLEIREQILTERSL